MPYYELKYTVDFCASHCLQVEHKCANLHGHNYKVTLVYRSAHLNKTHMVIDVYDIKPHIGEVMDGFDHENLNIFMSDPTAENIAKLIYDQMRQSTDKDPAFKDVILVRVDVAETDKVVASYVFEG